MHGMQIPPGEVCTRAKSTMVKFAWRANPTVVEKAKKRAGEVCTGKSHHGEVCTRAKSTMVEFARRANPTMVDFARRWDLHVTAIT